MSTGRAVHRTIVKTKTERTFSREERRRVGVGGGCLSSRAVPAERPAGFDLWDALRKGLICEGYPPKQKTPTNVWNDSNNS